MKNVEKLISMYGSNGYSVGDSLTWADIALFYMIEMTKIDKTNLEKFPLSLQIVQNVENDSRIAAYRKSRPETAF